MILVCTLLTGQFMIDKAFAMDGLVMVDGNGNVIPGDGKNQNPGDADLPDNEDIPDNDDVPDNDDIPGDQLIPGDQDEPVDQPDQNADQDGDGQLLTGILDGFTMVYGGRPEFLAEGTPLEVTVVSNQSTVKDGQKVNLSVSIFDEDPQEAPNINNSVVSIKLPSYLTTQNIYSALANATLSNLNMERSSYDPITNTITLVYAEKTTSDAKRDITLSLDVDLSSYDENANNDIVVSSGSGDMTITQPPKISVDTGETGSGEGEGNVNPGIEENPVTYLKKNIWSNVSGSSSDTLAIKDLTKPVGYTVNFGIKANYTGTIAAQDNLAGGNLALCSPSGTLYGDGASLADCISIKIGDVSYSLDAENTPLGAISVTMTGTGFKVQFSKDEPGTNTENMAVVVRYYAKVVGDAAKINNQVSISQNSEIIAGDSEEVLRSGEASLYLEKTIIDGNGNEQKVIDVTGQSGTATITFRIKMTQLSDELISLVPGKVIVVDILNSKFSFVEGSVRITGPGTENYSGYFAVEHSAGDNSVSIKKNNNMPLKAGEYDVDFSVTVNLDDIAPGEAVSNTVNNSIVYIRRDAELTVRKTWVDYDTHKNELSTGATVGLYTEKTGGRRIGNEITFNGSQASQSGVIQISAGAVKTGRNTYWLVETVPSESVYKTAAPVPVVIESDGMVVSLVSINNVALHSGTGTADVVNEPDNHRGSILFYKYGSDGKTLVTAAGGLYNLYRTFNQTPNPAADELVVGSFTTTNGVWRKDDLPYTNKDLLIGTSQTPRTYYYYVTEVNAPEGYVLTTETSNLVFLNKEAPEKTTSIRNDSFGNGEIKIRKTDAATGAVLKGVEFTLYDSNKNKLRGPVATGNDGMVTFKDLPVGTYYVKETKALSNYVGYSDYVAVKIVANNGQDLSAATDVTGTYTQLEGNKITLNWKNTEQKGSVSIEKLGETADKQQNPLKGVTFELTGPDGSVVSGVTNDEGKLTFTNLSYGKYILKETGTADGYDITSGGYLNGREITIDKNHQTVSVRIVNKTTRGSVSVRKSVVYQQNGQSVNTTLGGILFSLYRNETDTVALQTRTTNEAGICTFTDLDEGIYYVRESTPGGYKANSEALPVYVNVEHNGTSTWNYELPVVNVPNLYRVKVIKLDSSTQEPLAGAVFTLNCKPVFGGEFTITSEPTGADGIAVFENLPYGNYTLAETTFPEGYAQVAEPRNFVINSENVAPEITLSNNRTKLTVSKFDSETNQPLENAEFRIKDQTGAYVTAADLGNGRYEYTGTVTGQADAAVFKTFLGTGTASFVIEKLPIAGGYTLEEVTPPSGYLDQSTTVGFNIQKENESLVVGNTMIRADLRIIKTDGSGNVLPGIRFKLVTALGEVPVTKTAAGVYKYDPDSGETELETIHDGSLKVTGLTMGTYYLEELNVPDGLLSAGEIRIEVGQEVHNTEIFRNVINGLNTEYVEFTKVDSGNEPLQGAVFALELLDAVGNAFAGQPGKTYYATSGYDGVVRFVNIPSGVYSIREYIAPVGKTLSNDVFYVRVGVAAEAVPESVVSEYTELPTGHRWINEDRQNLVTVRKVSEDGKTFVPGAEFEILNENKEKISFVIHETGEVTDRFAVNAEEGMLIELPAGTYYLQEVKAPADHILNPLKQLFVVAENGDNVVVMKNNCYKGTLVIRKTDKNGTVLSGAEFVGYLKSDYDQLGYDAGVVFTAVTNSQGIARIENLTAGEYVVVETKAPEGYILDSRAQIAKITNEDPDVTEITLSYVNEKLRYVIEISKEDADHPGALLSGAGFAVTCGDFYREVTTDATGKVIVEVPGPGIYTITEIDPPDGYTLDTASYTVEVSEHTAEGSIPAAAFVSRDHVTKLILNKVDENGAPLAGAVFQILRDEAVMNFTAENGVYVWTAEAAEGTVDSIPVSEGTVEILKLPLGSYTLREITVPEGYMGTGDHAVRIDQTDDNANIVTVENLLYERGVAICKTDAEGIRLKDAIFGLYLADGTELDRKTTSASGYAAFQDLAMGTYYIRELEAPDGYQLDDRMIRFEINATGELISEEAFENRGSVEMPFFVLDVVNTPVVYKLRILKVSAADPEAKLQHAQFRIVGNGMNETVTTNEEGIAEIGLTVGEYMLTEVKAPEGYIADPNGYHVVVTSTGITVAGTALEGDIPVYTVENEPDDFQLIVTKVDADTGKLLSGAGFIIYDENQNVVHNLVTDASGVTNRVAMKPGIYYIQETVAPTGYLRPVKSWEVEITEDGNISCDNAKHASYDAEQRLLQLILTNKRTTGKLKLYKYEAGDESHALQGARFRLFDELNNPVKFTVVNGIYHADTAGTDNSVITGADGCVYIEELPIGEYKLYELEAPAGYQVMSDRYILIKLTHEDEQMQIRIPNEKLKKKVTIIKQDSNGVKLVGAEFALYDVSGTAPVLIAKDTTGSDGIAEFEVTFGSYQIFEITAPPGYEKLTDLAAEFTFDAETDEEKQFTYTVVNEKSKYALVIYKHEKGSADKGLRGAEFAVTNSLGFTRVITSGADGIARLDDLVYDDYTIREVKAPEGYYLTDQTYTIDREDLVHGQAVRFTFSNERILGSFWLKKIDYQDHNKVLDAEFKVKNSSGAVLKWEKTATGYVLANTGSEIIKAGNVKLENLPVGTYTIQEVKAPDGYVILEEERQFTITENNALAQTVVEITNLKRMTAVGVVKLDANDTSVRLAGAEFTLYPLNNSVQGQAIKTVTTDQNGMAVFTDLTMGVYRICETKAPNGYQAIIKNLDFKIDKDGKVTLVDNGSEISAPNQIHLMGVTNKPILNKFTIEKISSHTKKPLEGATFVITGGKTEIRLTTDKHGLASVDLPYGDYELREVVAPNGYVLERRVHKITVSEDGITMNGKKLQKQTLILENHPVEIPIVIHKQDGSSRAALEGAKFKITGTNFEQIVETDKDGNTGKIFLKPGEYKITETTAPKGYQKPLTSWVLKVTREGRVCAVGSFAIESSKSGLVTVVLENHKIPSLGGGGYSGGGSGSSVSNTITKTGQTFDRSLLNAGVLLTTASAAGLVMMLLDEIRRRRRQMA